jgi:hypothetical protein
MEVVGDNGSNICRLFQLFEQDQSSNFNFESDSEIESDSGEEYEEEDEKELEEEEEEEEDVEDEEEEDELHGNEDSDNNKFDELIPDFDKYDSELNEIRQDAVRIEREIYNATETIETESESEDQHETDCFFEKVNNEEPVDKLILQLDSVSGQKLSRYSCCVHKANNAIKKAIQSIPLFSKDLSQLTKWTKNVRKKNPKTKIYEIKSSRLRCENKTRWSSGFLNLISVYKAYKNKVNEVADCPLDFEKIKFYLQILLPAYRFTT